MCVVLNNLSSPRSVPGNSYIDHLAPRHRSEKIYYANFDQVLQFAVISYNNAVGFQHSSVPTTEHFVGTVTEFQALHKQVYIIFCV
jgi:hypothetical protein